MQSKCPLSDVKLKVDEKLGPHPIVVCIKGAMIYVKLDFIVQNPAENGSESNEIETFLYLHRNVMSKVCLLTNTANTNIFRLNKRGKKMHSYAPRLSIQS